LNMSMLRRNSIFQDLQRACMMTAIAVALVLVTRVAWAHAVLVLSSPVANALVSGPDVPVSLKFNSRVDGSRSTLLLSTADGASKPLTLDKQTAPDTLTTKAAGLGAGKYAIRWQVLATDGHITRGQIPFSVK
jgi:copper resistance protein C